MTLQFFTRSHLRRIAEAIGDNSSITHAAISNLWLEFGNGADLPDGTKMARANEMVSQISESKNADSQLLELVNETFYNAKDAQWRRKDITFTRMREYFIDSGFTEDRHGLSPQKPETRDSKVIYQRGVPRTEEEAAQRAELSRAKREAVQRATAERATREDATRIGLPSTSTISSAKPKPPFEKFEPITQSSIPVSKRSVFIVHGRDMENKSALVSLLKQMDIRPISWNEAVSLASTQSTLDIVEAGMANAQAVIVLFTPDDLARLKDEFLKDDDGPHESTPTGQARPNVILEAGMAYAKAPKRTIFVRVGKTREISDISGFNWVQLSDKFDDRDRLRRELLKAGVELDNHANIIDPMAGTFKI